MTEQPSPPLEVISPDEVDEVFRDMNGLSGPLRDLMFSQDIPTLPPVEEYLWSDLEEVEQTNGFIAAEQFEGGHKFRCQIRGIDSKSYTYSEKLKKLYCKIDKAVPIIFTWEKLDGTSPSYLRAMLMFKDPNDITSPVLRCRIHNDVTSESNRDCKHYQHIVRCDNENSTYKENKKSRRYSVVTPLDSNQNKEDGFTGLYRFMCNTSCNGPDAIARRPTNLIITLENSFHVVVGRVVVSVKICASPLRDKRNDEKEGEGRNKRKSDRDDFGSKKKREDNYEVPPSPLNIPPTDNVTTQMIKCGVNEESSDRKDFKVTIPLPNFPCNKVEEFVNMVIRLRASYNMTDDDVNVMTEGVQVKSA